MEALGQGYGRSPGFNEAEALKPRIPRSMLSWPAMLLCGFNEAEALKPRILFQSQLYLMALRLCFNEAEALKPRIREDNDNIILVKSMLQ